MANGNPKATWKITTDRMVPDMPSSEYSLTTGIKAIWIGITSSATTAGKIQSRPGNSIHADAYPAADPMNTTASEAGRGDQDRVEERRGERVVLQQCGVVARGQLRRMRDRVPAAGGVVVFTVALAIYALRGLLV